MKELRGRRYKGKVGLVGVDIGRIAHQLKPP